VVRKNILTARKSATKIGGGVTMVASCVRGLNLRLRMQSTFLFIVCIVLRHRGKFGNATTVLIMSSILHHIFLVFLCENSQHTYLNEFINCR
jgi:hypothetical protein